jgi:hypothetical protein
VIIEGIGPRPMKRSAMAEDRKRKFENERFLLLRRWIIVMTRMLRNIVEQVRHSLKARKKC